MKTFIIVLLVFFQIINSKAKVYSWLPLDSLEKSTLNLNLSDNRFIPSTKIWNLVWADQLVPNWLTDGKVEFAAKNYIGTQKIWDYQIEDYRKYNPNFLGLIYHLAVGLNPEHNDDCPNPKSQSGDGFIGVVSPEGYVSEWTTHFQPWLIKQGIALNSNRFESMFQHYDIEDKAHRVWHNDPYWLMNIANIDWNDYLIFQCKDWMTGNKNEGCFFDVSVETNSFLYNPKLQNPAPKNFNWWQEPHKPFAYNDKMINYSDFAPWMNDLYLNYFQNIYKAFHSSDTDFLVIPNTDQMVTTVYDPVWLDGDENGETIDGAMMEGFGNYKGYDMWLTLDRCIRHITGRGKILIAQFNANTPEERYRRTAMYMLVKNENSFININPQIVAWYPEYEINLGKQSALPKTLETLRVKGEGWQSLWKREYQNGIVFCNTSDSDMVIKTDDVPTFSINFWNVIHTSGGGEVSDSGQIQEQNIYFERLSPSSYIVIHSSECIIIHTIPFTDVKEKAYENNSFTVYPNPANNILNITFNTPMYSNTHIIIYDSFGRNIKELELSFAKKQIDLSDMVSGNYFIVLQNGYVKHYQRFSIIK